VFCDRLLMWTNTALCDLFVNADNVADQKKTVLFKIILCMMTVIMHNIYKKM